MVLLVEEKWAAKAPNLIRAGVEDTNHVPFHEVPCTSRWRVDYRIDQFRFSSFFKKSSIFRVRNNQKKL
ncbi:MAG: hypothetical protein JW944_03525 [Deltaproteobacteria bacterium]|nr:hypothetical protein [Deltaproteobacteria bacterium]